ncbi:MAG: metallophosphoesterase [Leptolyngbyaceae cyanobacterium bins.59]|nr:metallophosphoesterase [Leptolyngbyaceae cyanobacterium bins.59]
MRWQRFLFFALVGVLLWLGMACMKDGGATTQSPNPSPSPVAQEVSKPSPTPSKPEALPPETAAIVASAGPGKLYNPPRGDVRLVVISDLNSSYGSTDYDPEVDKGIKLIPFWQPDLVVCSGDMVAGQDLGLTKERLRAMWQAFEQHVTAPLRKANIPFGFTVGNHDASSAQGSGGRFVFQTERDLTAEFWRNPRHDPGVQFVDRSEFPFYYTFQYKDVFFLAWDGSSSYIPPAKLAWVEKALSSSEAKQAKLRILLGHLPLYAVAIGRDKPGEVMDNADQLRAMLEQYNVHTYISGHQHAYYPAHRGKLQLLHAGLLGSGPRRLLAGNLSPGKTLTVVDIKFDTSELTTYTTYDIQTLQQIQDKQLPRLLTGHNGTVFRRDVDASQLSEAEKKRCSQQSGKELCAA